MFTTEEFNRRVAQAQAWTHRPVMLLWTPALLGFLVMVGTLVVGEHRVPEWIGLTGMFMLLGFGFAGMIAGVVREGSANKQFGLLCAGCGKSLPGGKSNEITAHVRTTGCCYWCAAPVLSDHAGAREAIAHEAAATRSAPHASAFGRADFDGRVQRYRKGLTRWLMFVVVLGLGGMPLLVLVTQIPMDPRTRRIILMAGLMVLPLAVIGALIASRVMPRRVGLECPACRRVPLSNTDHSIVRTGICPHCSAVIVQPA
jgi:hypothetical protein